MVYPEAALSIYSKEPLAELQYRVGNIISSSYDQDNLERIMFTAVGLLNGGVDVFAKDMMTRLRIAKLNLDAGKRAMSIAAFHPAVEYLQVAKKLMPACHWRDQYEMSLELYSLATEVRFCIGDFKGAREYSVQVIDQKSPAADKLRVYHVLIDILTAEKRFQESIDLGLEVLRLFGCKLPHRKTSVVISNVLSTLGCKYCGVLGRAPTSFCNFPVATDKVNIGVMKTLHKIASSAYASKSPILPFVCVKEIQLDFR